MYHAEIPKFRAERMSKKHGGRGPCCGGFFLFLRWELWYTISRISCDTEGGAPPWQGIFDLSQILGQYAAGSGDGACFGCQGGVCAVGEHKGGTLRGLACGVPIFVFLPICRDWQRNLLGDKALTGEAVCKGAAGLIPVLDGIG